MNVLVDAWSPSSSPLEIEKNMPGVSRTTFLSNIVVTGTTSLWLLVSPTGDLSRDVSYAASIGDDDMDDFVRSITQTLSPATKERPPITLPNPSQSKPMLPNNNQITPPGRISPPSLPPPQRVEALITLENPQLRPSPSDILVLQVYESPLCHQLLGGARVPIARIRFPVQVQLTSANAISSSSQSLLGVEIWNTLTSSQDLWIVATVCPGMNDTIDDDDTTDGREAPATCPSPDKNHQIFQASGISKFLTSLPGIDPDSLRVETTGQQGIRLPATLALRHL